jgi:hypothetical protein
LRDVGRRDNTSDPLITKTTPWLVAQSVPWTRSPTSPTPTTRTIVQKVQWGHSQGGAKAHITRKIQRCKKADR